MGKKEEMLECLKNITIAGAPLILTPVGAALLSLANECFNSTAQTRQDKWNEEIVTKISNLSEDFEEKFNTCSNFASILATAQRGALEDIEEDKVGLYANAVINSIKNEDIDNTKIHIFLNMLRKYSKLHLGILQKFSPTSGNNIYEILKDIFCKRSNYHDNDLDTQIKAIFHQKDKFNPVEYTIVNELYNDNLFSVQVSPEHISYKESNLDIQITPLGQEFLQFIAEQEK
jgi:hypothetical protein